MFKLEDNKGYMMPVTFGGFELPAPDFAMHAYDTVTLSYICTTDDGQLANYVPESLELLQPEIVYAFSHVGEFDTMQGGSYNLIRVAVPVRFNGTRDQLEGQFELVVWENKTDEIIGGREKNGVPKIYADIEDLHGHAGDLYPGTPDYYTNASLNGWTFVRMGMSNPKPVGGEQLAAMQAAGPGMNIAWRYIPNVDLRGAALSQFIAYPVRTQIKSAWKGSGTVEWIKDYTGQLPTQSRIINALAELPVLEMAPVSLTRGEVSMGMSQGRVIE